MPDDGLPQVDKKMLEVVERARRVLRERGLSEAQIEARLKRSRRTAVLVQKDATRKKPSSWRS